MQSRGRNRSGVDLKTASLMQSRGGSNKMSSVGGVKRGDLREGSAERGKSGENAGQVDRLRTAAAGKTLRGLPHLLFIRHADRSLGKNQIRKDHARQNSRVHHRAVEDRSRLAARAD